MENALFHSLLSLVKVLPPIADHRMSCDVRTRGWERVERRKRRAPDDCFGYSIRKCSTETFEGYSPPRAFSRRLRSFVCGYLHVDFKGYFWRLLMCLWEAEAWWNGEWEGTAIAVLSSKCNQRSVLYIYLYRLKAGHTRSIKTIIKDEKSISNTICLIFSPALLGSC